MPRPKLGKVLKKFFTVRTFQRGGVVHATFSDEMDAKKEAENTPYPANLVRVDVHEKGRVICEIPFFKAVKI